MSDYHAEMTGKAAFIIQMLLACPSNPFYREDAKKWLEDRDAHLQETLRNAGIPLVKEVAE